VRLTPGTVALVAALAGPGLAAAGGSLPGLEETLAAQRELVAAEPGNAGARNDLGNLLLLVGDAEGAAAAYQEALRLDPMATLPRYNLGLLELEGGELASARRQFHRVLADDPGHALARYRLGDIAAARDHRARAVRRYEQAFRLDPALADPATHPGVLFNKLVPWALHRAYLASPPGLRPRRYDDPARLAGLLIGAAPEPPAEPVAPEEPVAPPEPAPPR
jgi:tetratricopeptide (TPR) repeat protein